MKNSHFLVYIYTISKFRCFAIKFKMTSIPARFNGRSPSSNAYLRCQTIQYNYSNFQFVSFYSQLQSIVLVYSAFLNVCHIICLQCGLVSFRLQLQLQLQTLLEIYISLSFPFQIINFTQFHPQFGGILVAMHTISKYIFRYTWQAIKVKF